MNPPIDLDKLKKLAEAATPGPWSFCPDEEEIHSDVVAEKSGDPYHIFPATNFKEFVLTDAPFIAAANPSTILELVAEIERLNMCMNTLNRDLSMIKAQCGFATDNLKSMVDRIDFRQPMFNSKLTASGNEALKEG